jgi:hypothetical protein
MNQTNEAPTQTHTPSDRITPFRRGWRLPRYQPHPDAIATALTALLVFDLFDRAVHIFERSSRLNAQSAVLFALFIGALWGIWRLTRGAIAYYDANPWIRRGYHQHKYSKKARDEFYDGLYYHDHHWAFPFHKYVFKANH